MNAVRVVRVSDIEVQMQWSSNTSNDMIADSALVVLLGIDSSPATVKRESTQLSMNECQLTTVTSHPHPHAHHDHAPGSSSDFDTLHMFLEAHFGDVSRPGVASHPPDGAERNGDGNGDADAEKDENDDLLAMTVRVDGAEATVDLISMKVASESDELRERVEAVLEMALTTVTPLSRLYAGQGLEHVHEHDEAAAEAA